jgi:hypothetical protein
MSLFANNYNNKFRHQFINSSKCVRTLFRNNNRTGNNIKGNSRCDLAYQDLYDDVGTDITNILSAFITGSKRLETLIDYNNYSTLADKFYSNSSANCEVYELYRHLLIDAVEGVKQCDNRTKEANNAYNALLNEYNKLLSGAPLPTELLADTVNLNVVANIKPELVEYVARGYKLVDLCGDLIPINLIVLAEIREQLGLT